MRRGIGVSAVTKRRNEQKQYAAVGKEAESVKLATVKELLNDFKIHLTEFATKHRKRINSDPEFRHLFCQMCTSVNVDPLASSKGIFADFLGLGNFYFELG